MNPTLIVFFSQRPNSFLYQNYRPPSPAVRIILKVQPILFLVKWNVKHLRLVGTVNTFYPALISTEHVSCQLDFLGQTLKNTNTVHKNTQKTQTLKYRKQTGGCQRGGRWGWNKWRELRGINFQLFKKKHKKNKNKNKKNHYVLPLSGVLSYSL